MIFYFSGTGNSLSIAKKIASSRHETLISIPEAIKSNAYTYTLNEDETIGFIYPVHGWAPPAMVREFIKKLSFTNYTSHYIYSIFTCGGTWEYTAKILHDILKSRQLHLKGNFHILMPGSFILAENHLPLEEEQRRIETAQNHINQLIDEIDNRTINYTDEKHSFLQSYIIGMKLFPIMTRFIDFKVNNKCIGCGICSKVCSVNAIHLVNQKPKRNSKSCQLCMACINCCPNEAINFGNKTVGRPRYRHPDFIIK